MTEMKLDKRFLNKARGMINGYHFDVGVLKDKIHRQAKPASAGHKGFPGGKARKVGGSSGLTISQISKDLRIKTGINFYTRPFKIKTNKEILLFVRNFFKYAFGNDHSSTKRLENSLQAIVRNPILRGDYGRNSAATAKIKGFNKLMVDTGQLFKNITAKVFKRSV